MVRVFLSRHCDGLKPGDGASIDWQIGETVSVISGQDEGRRFIVRTEGRRHADLPNGEYVREGYFEDDPARTRWAKPEKTLWFGA